LEARSETLAFDGEREIEFSAGELAVTLDLCGPFTIDATRHALVGRPATGLLAHRQTRRTATAPGIGRSRSSPEGDSPGRRQ